MSLPPTQRRAILHVDDVGMCHGANQAFLELFRAGRVTCGSVMVPCPWFPEIAAAAADDPSLDLGVHLTLTSEWPQYRWRPLSTTSPASGLLDDGGFFPRNLPALAPRVVPEAAEAEMRAQVDRAIAAGIAPTHLDTHMGAALLPALIDAYLRVARDYGLPALLPRQPAGYAGVLGLGTLDGADWPARAESLAAEGMPMVDAFRMTPGAPSAESDAAYRDLVLGLPEGLTFVAIHPNAPGDIETIVPPRAHFRTDEYRLLGSGRIAAWLAEAGVGTAGCREMLDRYRAARGGARP